MTLGGGSFYVFIAQMLLDSELWCVFLSTNIGGNGGFWVQIIKIRVIALSKVTLPWCRLPQTYHH